MHRTAEENGRGKIEERTTAIEQEKTTGKNFFAALKKTTSIFIEIENRLKIISVWCFPF